MPSFQHITLPGNLNEKFRKVQNVMENCISIVNSLPATLSAFETWSFKEQREAAWEGTSKQPHSVL